MTIEPKSGKPNSRNARGRALRLDRPAKLLRESSTSRREPNYESGGQEFESLRARPRGFEPLTFAFGGQRFNLMPGPRLAGGSQQPWLPSERSRSRVAVNCALSCHISPHSPDDGLICATLTPIQI